MIVVCPSCGTKNRLTDEFHGRRVYWCPSCSTFLDHPLACPEAQEDHHVAASLPSPDTDKLDQSVPPRQGRIIGNQTGMTTKQKAAIWLAVLLIVAASLYPPWLPARYVLDAAANDRLYTMITQMEQDGESHQTIQAAVDAFRQSNGKPQSYHWLFDQSPNGGKAAHVDLSRLFVEWIIVLAVAAGLYSAWPTVKSPLTKGQIKRIADPVWRYLEFAVDLFFRFALSLMLLGLAIAPRKLVPLTVTIFVIGIVIGGFTLRNVLAERRNDSGRASK